MDFSYLTNSNAVSSGQPSAWGLSGEAGKSPSSAASRVFSVCRVRGVLRAVLGFNGAWARGVRLGVKTPMEGLLQAGWVVSVALPCVLLWRALACASVFYRLSESKILTLKTLGVGVSALRIPLRLSA